VRPRATATFSPTRNAAPTDAVQDQHSQLLFIVGVKRYKIDDEREVGPPPPRRRTTRTDDEERDERD
jgi:hypothetical protein